MQCVNNGLFSLDSVLLPHSHIDSDKVKQAILFERAAASVLEMC